MTYTDLYLRADTAEDLRDACPFLWDNDADTWHSDTLLFSLSIIGPIAATHAINEDDTPGEMLDPGDDRFHANLRLVDTSLLDLIPSEMIVNPEPESPIRGWA